VALGIVSVTSLAETAEGVKWARPLERVVPRWALAEGVMQMADLELKELVCSEAALLPEIVAREAYSAAFCHSKE
jgi:hypothetical protein